MLLGTAIASLILSGFPQASAGSLGVTPHGLGAPRRAAPVATAETGRHAGDLAQKLADLAATIVRDKAAVLASMRALRDDYSAQTRKIERLEVALARFPEEFSERISRLRKLTERNAARLMAVDSAPPATRPATATRVARGARPPLRLAAIEYRGKEPAAVVLLNGRRRSVREGDALAGYRVFAISVAERALILAETATGKHYVLIAGTNHVAEYGAYPKN